MQAEVAKGQVELLLLAVLVVAPAHGYGIVETLRTRSGGAFDLAEGTVYPALYRLERAGLVASGWQSGGGRRRRVYRLPRRGHGALERRRADWRELTQAMETVLA